VGEGGATSTGNGIGGALGSGGALATGGALGSGGGATGSGIGGALATGWSHAKPFPGYAQIIGNNYVNFATPGGYSLYSALRSPSTPQFEATMSLDVTASGTPPTDATRVTGAFSGEPRIYDLGSIDTANSFQGTAKINLSAFQGSEGFVTIVPGGGVDGGSPEN